MNIVTNVYKLNQFIGRLNIAEAERTLPADTVDPVFTKQHNITSKHYINKHSDTSHSHAKLQKKIIPKSCTL